MKSIRIGFVIVILLFVTRGTLGIPNSPSPSPSPGPGANSGPCPAPQGYHYKSNSDKFYKTFTVKKTWDDASDECSKDEATLIEHRTVAEHQVLKGMYSKFT